MSEKGCGLFKDRYESRKAAMQAANSLRRHGGLDSAGYYFCEPCDCYHLTKKQVKPEKKTRFRRR